jgi:hypothetical protein
MAQSQLVGGGVVRANAQAVWAKVASNIDFSYFSAAALTNSINLFSMLRGTVLHGIKIKHTQAFAGPSISAYTISVGISGSNAKYASAFDVFQPVGSTIYQLSSNFSGEDDAAVTQITATAVSVGANLSAANAGIVSIWACLSAAPIGN